jgi:large subunit ribosomal protein L10
MPNATKLDKVRALKERIQGSNALLLAEYRGLSVKDATELRRALSETARFAVVKNTLMERAAGEAGIEDLEGLLAGPTAVAFVEGDVVAAAKKIVDAAAKFPALVLKGAYLEGRVLGAAEARALATLESREVMLSRIAGMLKSEMSRAASMFQALQSRFLGVLEAYRDQLPPGPAEAAAVMETPSADEMAESRETAEPPATAEAEETPAPETTEAAEASSSVEAPEGEGTSEVEASATDEEE